MCAELKNCPFCNEDIKKSAFFEEGDFLAIYNIAPVLPGHSLIIPKTHITSITELTPQELYNFIETSRNALKILMKAFNTDAFDWSIQEKPEAGQTIEHLHLHIVPRFKNDLKNPGDWYPLIQENDNMIIDSCNRARLNKEAMFQITSELKNIGNAIFKL